MEILGLRGNWIKMGRNKNKQIRKDNSSIKGLNVKKAICVVIISEVIIVVKLTPYF